MSRRVIIDEVEIEVPYGKLAGKSWHEETDECKRILVLHGWMDNAGSFDNLVPNIKCSQGCYVVAFDLPGHGKSAQFPAGSSYSDINIIMEVRRCLTELKWIQPVSIGVNGDSPTSRQMPNSRSFNRMNEALEKMSLEPRKKFSIIGHSLGAGLALFYASLFPDDVEELVLLDFIKAKTPPPEDLLRNTAESMDQFIFTVPSQSPFSSPIISKSSFSTHNPNKNIDKGQVIVSQETAILVTIEAHKQLGDLTRDDATCLLRRSTVAVSSPANSVIYSRDLRLQAMLNMRENWEMHKLMFHNVKCRILIVLATRGMYSEDELFRDKMDEMEAFLRERAKSLHIQWFDGDHYFHMNKPKQTAEIINKYLAAPDEYKITPLK